MSNYETLEEIKRTWNNDKITLGEKIIKISSDYYSSGLDLSTTAAYIKATQAELDSFLALGGFEDSIINMISNVNPPKSTWTMLASASDEEVIEALKVISNKCNFREDNPQNYTLSEYVYNKMIEMSGPTKEQKIQNIAANDLKHVLKKAEDYGILNDWERKFLNSIAAQKRKGKILSEKQLDHLIKILESLIQSNVISEKSIDGDQDVCDRILNALGK